VIWILAVRQLQVKRLRSLFLLVGFGLGVGVMIVLLSIGQAMLDQSRDVSLIGGGEVTILPEGIDPEAMRTGGVSGMFFGIDRARYVTRHLVGGPRNAAVVRAVSPAIENKLLYVRYGDRTVAARAGGEIPSQARAVGAGLRLLTGRWEDAGTDSVYLAPTAGQLYDEIDHFHFSPVSDSAWGEWHYFNLVTGPHEWWYLTYLVGGEVPRGRWGGQLLIAHRRADGGYERFKAAFPDSSVRIDTLHADVSLGPNSVIQGDGVYHLTASAPGPSGSARVDVTIRPAPNRYFPPAELGSAADFPSGYVVPVLRGDASGTLCDAGRCTAIASAPAYHDHNWGIWRGVSWDWGVAHGGEFDLLYGAVYPPAALASTGVSSPTLFVGLVDSLGLKQALRATGIKYTWPGADSGLGHPTGFTLTAARLEDTIRVGVSITDVLSSEQHAGSLTRHFLQMRGAFTLTGHVAGKAIADGGTGFFETYTR
jgi:hypothetical protein